MAGPHAVEALIGALYTAEGLHRRWDDAHGAGPAPLNELVSVPGSDGSMLYPAFQFIAPDAPWPKGQLPGVSAVAEVLIGAGASSLTACVWLMSPSDAFSGLSAVAKLCGCGVVDDVLAAARDDANRWGQ